MAQLQHSTIGCVSSWGEELLKCNFQSHKIFLLQMHTQDFMTKPAPVGHIS